MYNEEIFIMLINNTGRMETCFQRHYKRKHLYSGIFPIREGECMAVETLHNRSIEAGYNDFRHWVHVCEQLCLHVKRFN